MPLLEEKGNTYEIHLNIGNLNGDSNGGAGNWESAGTLPTYAAAFEYMKTFWKKHKTKHAARIAVHTADGNFKGWIS